MKTMAVGKRTNRDPVDPPDGGWGWAVVLAGFMVLACTFGVIRSLGVFFVPWREQFPEATAGEIALVQSLLTGITSLAAPVASALGRRFGFRPVIMAGGVIAAGGFSLSWFATQLFHLYITIGCIAGLGGSMCLTNVATCVGRYFTTKRLRANTLLTFGSGIASFAFPPLCQFLLDEYGTRGASVIVGGIVLHMTAFGALVRPLLLVADVKLDQDVNERKRKLSSSSSLLPHDLDHEPENVSTKAKGRDACFAVVDCTLLNDTSFMSFLLSIGLVASSYLVSEIYLVPRAKLLGIEEYPAAFLLSIIGISILIGRVLVAALSDFIKFKSINQYATVAALLGLAMLFVPLATSYGFMATYSVVFGLLSGAIVPLMLTATADLVEADRLPSAFGITMFLEGVTGLVGPPVLGALGDATGGFDATFLFAGAIVLVGGLLPFVQYCTRPCWLSGTLHRLITPPKREYSSLVIM